MQCKTCQGPASGACRRCGGFYCAKHGGITRGGPICAQCFEKGRGAYYLPAGLLAGIGAFSLFLLGTPVARTTNDKVGLSLMMLVFFTLAVLVVREGIRPNPWADRTGDE